MSHADEKLNWMYKTTVDREEYLLGRKIDKTIEQLTTEEKEKELGIAVPKNHVEHECIPPSIRDYNKLQVGEQQVDLATKLQEDPLITIKKREEETRKQFLQNPIQLKKMQMLLEKQMKKNKSSKKKKKKSYDLDEAIIEKLKKLKDGTVSIDDLINSEDVDIDKVLVKKFKKFKHKLSDDDFNELFIEKKPVREDKHNHDKGEVKYGESQNRYNDRDYKRRPENRNFRNPQFNSDRNKNRLTEEEKERRRKEMMDNAAWRDKERVENVKRYREEDARESKQEDFKPEFAHREFLKSANSSSVESRIKSNINNIQRGRGDMDKHFSRR